MSVSDGFTAATRAWLRHIKTLSLIFLAPKGRFLNGMPSWVIDWAHPGTQDHDTLRYWFYDQHGGDQARILQTDGTVRTGVEHDWQTRGILDSHFQVRGIIVDTVSKLVPGAVDPNIRTQVDYAMLTSGSQDSSPMACSQRYHISQPRGKQHYSRDHRNYTRHLANDSTFTTRLHIMDHRPQLPHCGSSQISDLKVEFNTECPPTPVLEGKHMVRRELPHDLEKCQEKTESEQMTVTTTIEGYQSHPYPSFAPPACTLRSPLPNTKELVRAATLYFGFQTFLRWFVSVAVLAGAGSVEARTRLDFDEEELEVVIPWWYAMTIFASLTATSRLTTCGAKLVMSRFGGPISGVWLSIYDNWPPAIAMTACWFVHLA